LVTNSDQFEIAVIVDANQENKTNELHNAQLGSVPVQAPLSSTPAEDSIPIFMVSKGAIHLTFLGEPGVYCKDGSVDTTVPKDCHGHGGPKERSFQPENPLAMIEGNNGEWSLFIQRDNDFPITMPACVCGNGQARLTCPCTDTERDEL
jgi:hypothetical protein